MQQWARGREILSSLSTTSSANLAALLSDSFLLGALSSFHPAAFPTHVLGSSVKSVLALVPIKCSGAASTSSFPQISRSPIRVLSLPASHHLSLHPVALPVPALLPTAGRAALNFASSSWDELRFRLCEHQSVPGVAESTSAPLWHWCHSMPTKLMPTLI